MNYTINPMNYIADKVDSYNMNEMEGIKSAKEGIKE